MRITLGFSTLFKQNLSQYKNRNAEKNTQKPPVFEAKIVEETKFQSKDLYLDYGKEEFQEKTKGKTVLPLEFQRTRRELKERPDLSKEITAAKERIVHEQYKQVEILDKEQGEIDKINVLHGKFQSSLTSNKEKFDCDKEKSELMQCLRSNLDCTVLMKTWKSCQEPKTVLD